MPSPLISKKVLQETAKKAGTEFVRSLERGAKSAFQILNDFEGHWTPGSPYSMVLHTRSWVYYKGVSTMIPISILGQEPLPDGYRIELQRRGWRTSTFGWGAGSVMGGKLGKAFNVTPEKRGQWDLDIDSERQHKIDKDIRRFLSQADAPRHHLVLETDYIRIPVASGDGYFRLVVYSSASSHSPVASSPVFRVASLTTEPAKLRGASSSTLVPELFFKSASSTVIGAAPTLNMIERMSAKRLANSAMNMLPSSSAPSVDGSGGRVRFNLESIGYRTPRDLKEDKRLGRGGTAFKRF
ncbi:hypothetical protein BDN70DRAFT_996328 [Pholiota conissans]|uniref:Uncharacterized protein n=1 Tax=Pholiota conissans TaxID=109636 RepID=A0A9P6CQ99_9AGAR|nr:hypothetical protein BDN70DRAFT_996328 [Pholiota conissans]